MAKRNGAKANPKSRTLGGRQSCAEPLPIYEFLKLRRRLRNWHRSPFLALDRMLDEITEKGSLRSCPDFFWQHATHSFAKQFLFHAPRHRRDSQEEAQQALIKQGRTQFDGHASPAGVFTFECPRPIFAGETGKSNGMQRMNCLWGFLKFPPSLAEIVSLYELLLQPFRKFGQRIGAAHPPPQPGAKSSPQLRDASILQDVPPIILQDGPESPLAEQVSQVGPCLPGQDVVSSVSRKDHSRVALHLSVLSLT